MILQNLISDDGTKSENGNFSNLEKYYIVQGSKRVQTSLLSDELEKATKDLSSIAKYKIVGGIRRKNLYVEDITILVEGNNDTINKLCEEFSLTRNKNKCSKFVSVNNKVIIENYIVVNKKYFGINCIKYTGSHVFVKMLEEKAKSLGIDFDTIKGETEKEVFNTLNIPYIEPKCRECEYDIRIPIKEILLKEIPSLNIMDNVVQFRDFVIEGKNYVERMKKNNKVGILLDCLSQYDKNQMDCFDFVVAGYYLNNQTSLSFSKLINNINKPLIIKSFGTDLSIPLRIVNTRVDWNKEFKNMVRNNVIVYVNGNENNLHPMLLNLYQKLGGRFIVENSVEAFELSKKALLAKNNIIHNSYRFRTGI